MRHVLPHFAMRLAIICSSSRAPDVLYSYTFNYASTIVTKLNASGEMRSEYEQTKFSQLAAPAPLSSSLPRQQACPPPRNAATAMAAGRRPWQRRLEMRMRHRSPDVLTPAGFYR